MRRAVCANIIKNALAPTDLVLCALGTVNRSWREQNAPQLSYFASDPMGVSLAMALGLALAQPARRVIAICGDGELLMSLGALVTIAGAGCDTLKIVCFNNARYETGGGQPLAGTAQTSLAAIAAGAGLPFAARADTEAEAGDKFAALLAFPGPGLLVLATDPEAAPYPPPGTWSQTEELALFVHRLAGELPA
jgi:thiamine pyrophosphate-dependent acetolactate synthase large subunit-like protein